MNIFTTIFIIILILYILFMFVPFYANRWYFTNGERIVVFQEMVHIGKYSFYKEVDEYIRFKRSKGFKIAYEGIDLKNNKFKKSYMNDKYKYVKQPYYLGDMCPNDIHADISETTFCHIKENGEFEALHLNDCSDNNDVNEKMIKCNTISVFLLKPLYHLVVFLSYILKLDKDSIDPIDKERNRLVRNVIRFNNSEKLLVIYGKLHFPYIYKSLKSTESGWRISRKEKIKVF